MKSNLVNNLIENGYLIPSPPPKSEKRDIIYKRRKQYISSKEYNNEYNLNQIKDEAYQLLFLV